MWEEQAEGQGLGTVGIEGRVCVHACGRGGGGQVPTGTGGRWPGTQAEAGQGDGAV